jgi:hypothetical protein
MMKIVLLYLAVVLSTWALDELAQHHTKLSFACMAAITATGLWVLNYAPTYSLDGWALVFVGTGAFFMYTGDRTSLL